jgi:hypothetical protein
MNGSGGAAHLQQFSSDGIVGMAGLGVIGSSVGMNGMGLGLSGGIGPSGIGGVGAVGEAVELHGSITAAMLGTMRPRCAAMLTEDDFDFLATCVRTARIPMVAAPDAGQVLARADQEWLLLEVRNSEGGDGWIDLAKLQVRQSQTGAEAGAARPCQN